MIDFSRADAFSHTALYAGSVHGAESVQRQPGRNVLVVVPVGELVKRDRAGGGVHEEQIVSHDKKRKPGRSDSRASSPAGLAVTGLRLTPAPPSGRCPPCRPS